MKIKKIIFVIVTVIALIAGCYYIASGQTYTSITFILIFLGNLFNMFSKEKIN